MEIISTNQVDKIAFEDPVFTGPEVTMQKLLPESDQLDVNIINFGKGVRNKMHYHSTEQILIVTGGTGIVATETEERIVTVGDIIRIPAGEKHWHGASPTTAMSHIAIQEQQDGKAVDWLEHVTDEQYRASNSG